MSENTKRAARHALIDYKGRCHDLDPDQEHRHIGTSITCLIVDLLVAGHEDLEDFPIQGTVAQALEMALAETQPEED